jgi:hypothetical protein
MAGGSSLKLSMSGDAPKPRLCAWISSAPRSRRRTVAAGGDVTLRRHMGGIASIAVADPDHDKTKLRLRSSIAKPEVRDALALQCGASLEELDHLDDGSGNGAYNGWRWLALHTPAALFFGTQQPIPGPYGRRPQTKYLHQWRGPNFPKVPTRCGHTLDPTTPQALSLWIPPARQSNALKRSATVLAFLGLLWWRLQRRTILC